MRRLERKPNGNLNAAALGGQKARFFDPCHQIGKKLILASLPSFEASANRFALMLRKGFPGRKVNPIFCGPIAEQPKPFALHGVWLSPCDCQRFKSGRLYLAPLGTLAAVCSIAKNASALIKAPVFSNQPLLNISRLFKGFANLRDPYKRWVDGDAAGVLP
jgi:hypothetical protein